MPNKFSNTLRQFEDSVLVKDMHDLVNEMRRRKYNLWWLMVPVSGIVCFLGFGGYSLLKEKTTKEVTGFSADLIKKLLDDENTKIVVDKFCHDTVSTLIASEDIQNEVTQVVRKILTGLTHEEYIRDRLSELFYNVFMTQTVRQGGSELSANVVQNIINGNDYEWLRQEIYKYISLEIEKVTNDKEIQNQLNQVAWKTVTSLFSMNTNQIKTNEVPN